MGWLLVWFGLLFGFVCFGLVFCLRLLLRFWLFWDFVLFLISCTLCCALFAYVWCCVCGAMFELVFFVVWLH